MPESTCVMDGCGKPICTRLLCKAHYVRFLRNGHPERLPVDRSHRLGLAERLWLNRNVTDGGCWQWTGAIADTGYGTIGIVGQSLHVHRVSYELLVGPIPDGLTIDHLCRNRACFNPLHLEPVTQAENNARARHYNAAKTHCPQGHEYTSENTYTYKGSRRCKVCQNESRLKQGCGAGLTAAGTPA